MAIDMINDICYVRRLWDVEDNIAKRRERTGRLWPVQALEKWINQNSKSEIVFLVLKHFRTNNSSNQKTQVRHDVILTKRTTVLLAWDFGKTTDGDKVDNYYN